MGDAFCGVCTRLPFAILEIRPGNGAEFFNQHFVCLGRDTVKGAKLSRSRSLDKNDNRLYDKMWLPKVQLLRASDAFAVEDNPL